MMSSIYFFRKGKIMGTRNRSVVARKWLGADSQEGGGVGSYRRWPEKREVFEMVKL